MSGPSAGRKAEAWAADKWDLERCPNLEWCDLRKPRTRAPWQVKAASIRESGKPARVRLWRDQHMALSGAKAHRSAWYLFVKLDADQERVKGWARREPATVGKWVREAGGWNKSGHRAGALQKKMKVERFL